MLIVGGVLVIAATVLILFPRQNTETAAPTEVLESAPVQADIPFPQVPRISIAETKAHFDANSAIIVDVRRADDFAASHIPNALSIPEDELEASLGELPQDAEILLYCT